MGIEAEPRRLTLVAPCCLLYWSFWWRCGRGLSPDVIMVGMDFDVNPAERLGQSGGSEPHKLKDIIRGEYLPCLLWWGPIPSCTTPPPPPPSASHHLYPPSIVPVCCCALYSLQRGIYAALGPLDQRLVSRYQYTTRFYEANTVIQRSHPTVNLIFRLFRTQTYASTMRRTVHVVGGF